MLHKMGIVITTYKMKNLSTKQSATLITSEFTGTFTDRFEGKISY